MAELKKANRKLIRLPNGKVGVIYVDAETGRQLSSLDGYTLIDSGGFGQGQGPVINQGAPPTDDLERTSSRDSGRSSGDYSPADPFDWDAFENRPGASRGSGNIIQDLARTWTNVKAGIQDVKQNVYNAGAEALGVPTTTDGPGWGTHKEEVERFTGVDMVPGMGVDGKGTPANPPNPATRSPLASPSNTPTPPADIPSNGVFAPARWASGTKEGVDPKLIDIINEAALRSPYKVEIISGKDHRDTSSHHPGGKAIDVQLIDPDTGRKITNHPYLYGGTAEGMAKDFRIMEQFAQTAKVVQSNKYPELDQSLVWGGYFWSGGPGAVGNADTMHFDLGGKQAAGTWETGLKPQYLKKYSEVYGPSISSKGLGNPKDYPLSQPGEPIPGIGFEATRSALVSPNVPTPPNRPAESEQGISSKLQEALGFLPDAAKSVMSTRIPLDRIANNLIDNLPAENIGAAARAYDDSTGVLSGAERVGLNAPFGIGDNIAKGEAQKFLDNNTIVDPTIGDAVGVGRIPHLDAIGDLAGGVVDDLIQAFPQAAQQQTDTGTALAATKQTPKMLESNLEGPYSLNDPERRRILAQTILGEAAGEGVDGMAAVAHVIRNRSLDGQWPSDPMEVALQNNGKGIHQFSPWNAPSHEGNSPDKKYPVGSKEFNIAANIADMVFRGHIPDMTGGATHFHTPNVSPPWSTELLRQTGQPTLQLGNHVFYPEKPIDPVLNKTASAFASPTRSPDRNLAARDSSAGTTQSTLGVSKHTPVRVASDNSPSAIPAGSTRNTSARDSSSGPSSVGSPFAAPQKVTTPTGGTVTKEQRDAMSSTSDRGSSYSPANAFMSGPTPKPSVTHHSAARDSSAGTTVSKKSSSSGSSYSPGEPFSAPSKSSSGGFISKSTSDHNPAARDSSAGTTKSTKTTSTPTTTRRDPWGGGAR